MIDQFIESTNRAKTKEDIYDLYLREMKKFGYDRVNYSYVTDQPDLNQQAEFGLETTYPSDWLDRYVEQNYMVVDPPFLHAMKYDGPFTWASLINRWEYTPVQNQINNEAEEFKMFKGAAVAIHGRFGGLSGVGVASSYDKEMPNLDVLRKIDALTRQFHFAYSDHNKACNPKFSLTQRECEILLWAAEGKTDQIIADILMITHATVRFHITNIFKKLEVNERTLAIVKAIRYGLITPTNLRTPYQG